jgi:hypothetical protein
MPAQHDTVVTALPDTSRGRPLPVPKPTPGMQSNIRVEQPRAGARVAGPSFVVSGMSRTFENSISYELLSSEGNVISQGHGMSNGSMGQFGPYHLNVNTQGYKGIATLEVFDLSPKDGSRIDVVLVPITIVSDTIGISPNDRITTMPIKK